MSVRATGHALDNPVWSLWRRFDVRPGSFERWVDATIPWGTAA